MESATALCAALNLAFFLYRLASPRDETPSRRAAAFVLALVSLGVAAESGSVLVSVWQAGGGPVAPLPWALARTVTFVGVAGMSALVLRRIADE